MNKYIARKQSGWLIICDFPDVCKTPIGSSMVPVPYPVTAKLTDSVSVVKSVKTNSKPIVVYDKTKVSKTLGDQAGVGKGVKSGTVGGKCYPKTKSKTVKAGKKYIVREKDKFGMNGK